MNSRVKISVICILCLFISCNNDSKYIDGFVVLDSKNIVIDLSYNSSNNFVGKKIDGYSSNKCILTNEAALAIKVAANEFYSKGYKLKILDAYRPQKAVDQFYQWSKDLNDTLTKSSYYPNINKSELFEKGYIAKQSGHSRGSTVDVTLIDIKTSEELDMGTDYDFFGEESWAEYQGLSKKQLENRKLLRQVMMKNGFKPLKEEWWHFTLSNEPFPDIYFNFPIL